MYRERTIRRIAVVLAVLAVAFAALRFAGPAAVGSRVNAMLEFSVVAALIIAGVCIRFSQRAVVAVLAILIVGGASASS